MKYFVSLKKGLVALIGSFLLIMNFSLGIAQAHPQTASRPASNTHTCTPSGFTNNGAAFPYTATETGQTGCGSLFYWGWTTAGSANGIAYWWGTPGRCTISVFIPNNHAGAQDAQYFIHSGSNYLANVLVNQNNHSGWVVLGTWTFSQKAYVTLSNLSPSGQSGWQIAAGDMLFGCV